jgi:hypothetical protein
MSGSISGNPQVPQGVINRIRGNIQVPSYPNLSITAAFLGEQAFEFTRTGPATTMIGSLTGRVASPEPYQPVSINVHLVKSQALAAQWESQLVALSLVGNLLLYTDAATMPTYQFSNCAIENVGPIATNGKSIDYMLTLTGTYIINNNLWALVV